MENEIERVIDGLVEQEPRLERDPGEEVVLNCEFTWEVPHPPDVTGHYPWRLFEEDSPMILEIARVVQKHLSKELDGVTSVRIRESKLEW